MHQIIKLVAKSALGRRIRMWMCNFILWILTISRRRGTAILMYHSISLDSDIRIFSDIGVSPDNFEKQMRYIAEKKKVISLATFLDYAKKKDRRLKDSVIITFDDGYLDNYELALPILKKYGLPATFFIATGLIGRTPVWDKLNYIIMSSKRNGASISLSNGASKEVPLISGKDNRYDFVSKTAYVMKHMSYERQSSFLKLISAELHDDTFDVERYNPKVMMSWEDCKAMSAYDEVSFGAHTVSHANLARLSPDEAREEIIRSKEELERCTGQQVRFFAYPYGDRSDYNDDVMEILKQSRFQCALTTEPGVNDGSDDLFQLKRIQAPNDGGLLFRFNLLGRAGGMLGKLFERIYVYTS